MSRYRIGPAASRRLDEIYEYSLNTWGPDTADQYMRGLFDRFEAIAARRTPWRSVAAELGIDGFVSRYERHYIYWKVLSDGAIGIVTVLHERMHQMDRFREDER